MNKTLLEQLQTIPRKSGVYMFKDKTGAVIYVGKAINLKNRVSQYLRQNDSRAQIPFLLSEARSIEHIIASNEWESLVLENNLIKKYLPKYNIKLRDDKNYALIKINFDSQIPQIEIVRSADSKNAKYFGPFSSALKVRETLRMVKKIFPYCANSEPGNRPCFYYYLHRCPGVCIGKISLPEYKKNIEQIAGFLSGRVSNTKKTLKERMALAADKKNFEQAAILRDELRSLEVMTQKQKALFVRKVDWDFISYYTAGDKTAVNLFAVREGLLTDRKNFILENTFEKSGAETIGAFIGSYYLPTEDLPKNIFVQNMPAEMRSLQIEKKKIPISEPKRGKKAQLIKLGAENARDYFENWIKDQAGEISRIVAGLAELQKSLLLESPPQRIECFDISNISGTNSVASMVVFENGKPKKSDYRKFKMSIDGAPNDFAMINEALARRFSAAHLANGLAKWALPDLLVIDGGKGQLGIAAALLKSRGLDIPVIGLAKREEEIFVPGKSNPIVLEKSNPGLQLLQRLRDEAHRFAITFHKKLRSKEAYKSSLDQIAGIGPKTKKALLKEFGSVKNIKAASPEELQKIAGKSLAAKIKSQL